MRWIGFSGGIFLGTFLGLIIGLFLGVQLGHVNADIDFCADSTSPRYIYADDVRNDVC